MGKCLWIGSSQRLWQIEAQSSHIRPLHTQFQALPGTVFLTLLAWNPLRWLISGKSWRSY